MKIVILQETIQKALSVSSRIANTSNQLPILSTVYIQAKKEGITFSSTNLELSLNYWAGAKVEREGEVVVPIKQLAEAINLMPKEKIELTYDGGGLLVKSQGIELELNVLKKEEFPAIPTMKSGEKGGSRIVFSKKELVECEKRVCFATASEEGRAVLAGVLFNLRKEGVEAVATDGYRLSRFLFKATKKGNSESKVIIPARALTELVRVAGDQEEEVGMAVGEKENQVIFSFSNGELVSRLISGDFPDYGRILPSGEGKSFLVDRDDLERAIKLASVFAKETANVVRIRVGNKKVVVEANSRDVGKGKAVVEAEGAEGEAQMAFNYRFLNDMMKSISTREVSINIGEEQKPGIFRENGNPDFLHLIMPVRLQAE